jgi:uncharacterized membrane protein
MQQVEVKFGDWIQRGFDLYKDNIGILIVVGLIAVVLSSITLGVLAGPMFAGAILITLALHDRKEPKPEIGDLFKGFDFFLQSLLFVVVWVIVAAVGSFILGQIWCLGWVLSMAYMLVLEALLMFGMFLIVDRKREFWPASIESIEAVKANFVPFLGLSVLAGLIAASGVILCVVGVAITLPIGLCILTVAYREVFGGGPTEAAVATPVQPPASPTAPVATESAEPAAEPETADGTDPAAPEPGQEEKS